MNVQKVVSLREQKWPSLVPVDRARVFWPWAWLSEHPSHRGVEILDFDFELQVGPRWHGWLRRAAGRAGIPIPPRTVLDGLDSAARLDAWYVLARRRLSEAAETRLNGGPVESAELKPNDRFQLGRLSFSYIVERRPGT